MGRIEDTRREGNDMEAEAKAYVGLQSHSL